MGDALAVALLERRGFQAEDFAFIHPGGALGRKLLLKVEELMHRGDEVPRVRQDLTMREAIPVMQQHAITSLLIVDEAGRVDGVIHLHDLLRAGGV